MSRSHSARHAAEEVVDNVEPRSVADWENKEPTRSTSPSESEQSVEDQVEDQDDCDAPDSIFKSYLNSIMVIVVATCYILLNFVPNIAEQINNYSQQQTPIVTSVPSDGASTVYQSAKPSSPFFTKDSVVYDSYNGMLYPAGKALEEHGYVFVMYYASWSARSILARDEFEVAAGIMNGRVPFVAVNCWYQSSQCKTKYKFYSFPSFYVYASGMETGFAFTGVEKASYFVRFAQSLLNPITHILNTSQLINFVSNQESSLVGYFNLSKPEPAGRFQQFYYASLRSIEKDFIQPVRFGVVSDQRFASQYSMDERNNLLLVRSVKDNLPYPSSGNFTSTAITAWVNKYQVKPLVTWLFPRGKKSAELYKTLQSGPTVILLTPYDACSAYNHDVSLLREVVLDYYACNATEEEKGKISTFINGSISSRRSPSQQTVCTQCEPVQQQSVSQSTCCFSLSDSSSTCQVCTTQRPCSGHCTLCQHITESVCADLSSTCNHLCHSLRRRFPFIAGEEICCHRVGQRQCRRFTDNYVLRHQRCYPYTPQAVHGFQHSDCISNIRLSDDSIICGSNSTPNFLAVDSSMYSELVQRFGIDITAEPRSHLAMVNLTDESYYVMKGQYNKSAIVNFLKGLSAKIIPRELSVAHPVQSPYPQYEKNSLSVADVNVVQFENILANRERIKNDVVVLFYAKWCLHCKAVHHLFLSAVNYLSKLTSIQFVRLDVSSNTLAWKHAVNRVPTITIFTHRGESEPLPQVHNVEQLLRLILGLCSVEHLIELAFKTRHNTADTVLPLLRSRITELERKLKVDDPVYDETQDSEMHTFILWNRRGADLLLLSLRKLYLSIYHSSLLNERKLRPEALLKFYTRLRSLPSSRGQRIHTSYFV